MKQFEWLTVLWRLSQNWERKQKGCPGPESSRARTQSWALEGMPTQPHYFALLYSTLWVTSWQGYKGQQPTPNQRRWHKGPRGVAGSSLAPQMSRPGSDTTGSYPISTLSIPWQPGGRRAACYNGLSVNPRLRGLYFQNISCLCFILAE